MKLVLQLQRCGLRKNTFICNLVESILMTVLSKHIHFGKEHT